MIHQLIQDQELVAEILFNLIMINNLIKYKKSHMNKYPIKKVKEKKVIKKKDLTLKVNQKKIQIIKQTKEAIYFNIP
jgi:hypothetical protein